MGTAWHTQLLFYKQTFPDQAPNFDHSLCRAGELVERARPMKENSNLCHREVTAPKCTFSWLVRHDQAHWSIVLPSNCAMPSSGCHWRLRCETRLYKRRSQNNRVHITNASIQATRLQMSQFTLKVTDVSISAKRLRTRQLRERLQMRQLRERLQTRQLRERLQMRQFPRRVW